MGGISFLLVAGTTTHIFETGCFTSLPCIFTIAQRTIPLGSGNVFKILPKGHLLLGVFLSTRITMSFTITLRFVSYHFCRCFMVGKYSWAHCLQKRLAKCWAWRHLRTIKESLFLQYQWEAYPMPDRAVAHRYV